MVGTVALLRIWDCGLTLASCRFGMREGCDVAKLRLRTGVEEGNTLAFIRCERESSARHAP